MLYLLRTLLRYCGVRGLACDPSKHMVFLCQHYSRDVQAVRTQLDQNFAQKNFLATPFCQRLSAEDQRVCYRALLNTEPPPNTAKILPTVQTGHKYSFSASGAATGTRSVSQKSSPSLVTQASCELLNLPHHIAAIPPREQGTEGKNQLWDISVTHEQTPPTASELPATHLDARSRYRPISVPTRNIHSTSIQLKTCKSSELRLLHTERVPRSTAPGLASHISSSNATINAKSWCRSRYPDLITRTPRTATVHSPKTTNVHHASRIVSNACAI
jgi:hypothetical protein